MSSTFGNIQNLPTLFDDKTWELLQDFTYKEDNSPRLSRDTSEIPDLESLYFSKTSDFNYQFNKSQVKISEISIISNSFSDGTAARDDKVQPIKKASNTCRQKKRGRKRLYGHIIKKAKLAREVVEQKTTKFKNRVL